MAVKQPGQFATSHQLDKLAKDEIAKNRNLSLSHLSLLPLGTSRLERLEIPWESESESDRGVIKTSIRRSKGWIHAWLARIFQGLRKNMFKSD